MVKVFNKKAADKDSSSNNLNKGNASIDSSNGINEDTNKKKSTGLEKTRENLKSVGDGMKVVSKDENEAANKVDDILLSKIIPNPENPRTKYIQVSDPTYNCFDEDHPKYKENQDVIDSIIELSLNIKKVGLINPITVYFDKGRYKIICGNTRYFAFLLAYGDIYTIKSRIYDERPSDFYAQFCSENNRQGTLSFSAKIEGFSHGYNEVVGKYNKGADIYNALGLTKTTYYVYKYIVEHQSFYEICLMSFIKKYSEAIELKSLVDKNEYGMLLNIFKENPGILLHDAISLLKSGKTIVEKQIEEPKKKNQKYVSAKVKTKDTAGTIKKIINGDLANLDWEDLDWNNLEEVQKRLSENIAKLDD